MQGIPQINLGDEATNIFLCAGGDADDATPDIKDFLDWLSGKKGREEGMQQGMRQGTMTTLFSLVEDGILTLDDAVSRVNMTPKKFKEAMEKPVSV